MVFWNIQQLAMMPSKRHCLLGKSYESHCVLNIVARLGEADKVDCILLCLDAGWYEVPIPHVFTGVNTVTNRVFILINSNSELGYSQNAYFSVKEYPDVF